MFMSKNWELWRHKFTSVIYPTKTLEFFTEVDTNFVLFSETPYKIIYLYIFRFEYFLVQFIVS